MEREPRKLPEYREAIVTFLDILGFDALVRRASPDKIHRSLRIAASAGTEISEYQTDRDHKSIEISTHVFSDSIVRVRFFDVKVFSMEMLCELESIENLQHTLVGRQVFMRGGVTIGKVYSDQKTIFGPAMIRAYRLESEFAVYPRIVLDPEVFNHSDGRASALAREEPDDGEEHRWSKHLKIDRDGLYYVDYLSGVLSVESDSEKKYDILLRHRKNLVKQARGAGGDARALDKYRWLAEYHNRVCEREGLAKSQSPSIYEPWLL